MADYKVQFEVFEGPLDLLLYLVKKQEVDIWEVNLTKLATEFIEYVDLMRELDLELAGEFLVMAATLMYIKSRELLPVDQQVKPEGQEEGEDDPRWELIRKLVEYKKFKDAAGQLQELEIRQENVFERRPAKPEFEPERPVARADVSIFDLVNAVNTVLKRFSAREETRDIFQDKWTVSEKIELLRQLAATGRRLSFSELFSEATSRSEIVVTFLALLELIRLRQIICSQEAEFGEIVIERVAEPSAPGASPATESSDSATRLAATIQPAGAPA